MNEPKNDLHKRLQWQSQHSEVRPHVRLFVSLCLLSGFTRFMHLQQEVPLGSDAANRTYRAAEHASPAGADSAATRSAASQAKT